MQRVGLNQIYPYMVALSCLFLIRLVNSEYVLTCALNSNTKLNVFSLPYVFDLLYKLGKAKYFSSKDLATAYQ